MDGSNKQMRRQNATKSGPREFRVDYWEKEEKESIKERYEKLRDTIEDWETKKKNKANLKLERREAELDKKRAKDVESYHNEIRTIEEIAGGAKAQALENRRNEEFKVKEKANMIKSTEKLPATCFCL